MKRKNPIRTLRRHPDLFGGKTPVVFANWRDVETWRLEDMTDDNIDEESLAEIEEEEPEIYKEIVQNSEWAQEERIAPAVKLLREGAEWVAEDLSIMEDREMVLDHFIFILQDSSPQRILSLIGDDELEALADAFDADQVAEILRDPMHYEVSRESHEYNVADWNIRSSELYISPDDEEVRDAFKELRDQGDVEALVSKLESENPYLTFPGDFVYGNIEPGKDDFSIDVPVDVDFYFGTDDLDGIKEAISELNAVETKLEGPEHDNIVYKFDDGYYVAELRANQLPAEGRKQGMCVGRADMGYIQGVIEGSTEIYSLRRPGGKPLLTFEVDLDSPVTVDQVKGKGNRLPGFAYDDHERLRRPDEVRRAVEFINHYLWFRHPPSKSIVVGGGRYGGVMADEIEDLKPAMEAMEYYYDDEGRAVLEHADTKWKIVVNGPDSIVKEVLDAGVDTSGIFPTKGAALVHIRTVLAPEAESVSELGYQVRFYAEAIRENPGRSIPVSPDVQALAEEAFRHPWGGEW